MSRTCLIKICELPMPNRKNIKMFNLTLAELTKVSLTACLLFALSACGGDTDNPSDVDSPIESEDPQTGNGDDNDEPDDVTINISDLFSSQDQDTSQVLTLIANASDDSSVVFSIVSPPSQGTLSVINGNQVSYMPNTHYVGFDTFRFKATTGEVSAEANFSLTINEVSAPTDEVTININDLSSSQDQDTLNVLTLMADASDDSNVVFSIVTSPSQGTLSAINGNQVSYQPNTNYVGTDTFRFKASTGEVTAEANFIVTINEVIESLTVSSQALNITLALNGTADITLQGSSNQEGDITYQYSAPQNGSLSGTAPNLTYTPNENFSGSDSFSYTAALNSVQSESSPVAINIINTDVQLKSVFVETSDLRSRNLDEEVAIEYGFIDENGNFPKSAGDFYHWNENAENYIEVGYRTGKAIHEAGLLTKNDDANTMKVFFMAGQSNMEGKGRCYESERSRTEDDGITPNYENIAKSTLDYLYTNNEYLLSLEDKVNGGTVVGDAGDPLYSFLDQLNDDNELSVNYLEARDDAWAVTYDSDAGEYIKKSKIFPESELGKPIALQPGLNNDNGGQCGYGIELAMGHYLAERYESPIMMFKAAKGGKTLVFNFRPETAVTKRGGVIGANYLNSKDAFIEFVDNLNPADYNVTNIEVAAFVWLQGWNDRGNAVAMNEYKFNAIDLTNDFRTAFNLPGLPAVMIASPHQNGADDLDITQAKRDAVALLNNPVVTTPPEVTSVDFSNSDADVNSEVTISLNVLDAENDDLNYLWAFECFEVDDESGCVDNDYELTLDEEFPNKVTISSALAGKVTLGVWIDDGVEQIVKRIEIPFSD